MTDWAAMNHRVKSLLAGLDLEMPGSGEVNDKKIVEAVRDGNLEEPMLDDAVRRILRLIFRTTGRKKIPQKGDLLESHHELAKKAAAESIVLLKNDGGLLPLHPDLKIALIGPFAEESRYQGGGSSHINPYRLEHLIDVIRDRGELHVTYCKGFNKEDNRVNGNLELEALNTAGNADLAIVYLGLPDSCESESFDRKDMCLPPNQSHLMEELLKVQKNIVVILAAGAPVEMPWALKVPAILQGYLFGQAGAGAMYNILTGKITPSGKLAETYPLRLKDNPSYLNFPGDSDQVSYHEGIYVGYRYYEKKEMKVAFPFGHGLSYTAFTYKKIELDSHRITDMDELTIAVTVRNAGSRPGKETVQLYVASPDSIVSRPVKELKGFQKAELQPGEEHKFVFHLNRRAFAYYDTELDDWFVEEGTFRILAGTSSADIRLEDSVFIRSTVSRWKPLTLNSTIEDLMGFPEGKKLGIRLSRVIISDLPDTKDTMDEELISEGMGFDVVAMVGDLQLKMLILFSNGSILEEEVQKELNSINKQYENQGE